MIVAPEVDHACPHGDDERPDRRPAPLEATRRAHADQRSHEQGVASSTSLTPPRDSWRWWRTVSSPSRSPSWRGAPPGKSSNALRAAIPGGGGQRGWRTRHRGGVRSGVILVHPLPVRCPPCGRRRAPRSPTSGPIPGERDRFRPLAPPVAVWAAFWGRFADVAVAAGSRAVGRRWAWRCAGLVRPA